MVNRPWGMIACLAAVVVMVLSGVHQVRAGPIGTDGQVDALFVLPYEKEVLALAETEVWPTTLPTDVYALQAFKTDTIEIVARSERQKHTGTFTVESKPAMPTLNRERLRSSRTGKSVLAGPKATLSGQETLVTQKAVVRFRRE